jgi:beta-glucosidase
MQIPQNKGIKDSLRMTVTVKNTGKYDGDDIVLVYMNDIYSSITTPVKQLIDFRRIHLKKGEEKTLNFTIPPERFSFLDKNFKPVVEPGEFQIMVENKVDTLMIK